jgi:DNA-binding HxlR family transcriptional regulator
MGSPPGKFATDRKREEEAMPLKMRKGVPQPKDMCPVGAAMSFLTGAWAPNVIWHLQGAPRRFSELQADMKPISAKVLSQRLRELESKGVVIRTVMNTSPPSVEYALSDLGRELVPAIEAIAKVGAKLRQRGEAEARAAARRARI